jgi:hypothetical protein
VGKLLPCGFYFHTSDKSHSFVFLTTHFYSEIYCVDEEYYFSQIFLYTGVCENVLFLFPNHGNRMKKIVNCIFCHEVNVENTYWKNYFDVVNDLYTEGVSAHPWVNTSQRIGMKMNVLKKKTLIYLSLWMDSLRGVDYLTWVVDILFSNVLAFHSYDILKSYCLHFFALVSYFWVISYCYWVVIY